LNAFTYYRRLRQRRLSVWMSLTAILVYAIYLYQISLLINTCAHFTGTDATVTKKRHYKWFFSRFFCLFRRVLQHVAWLYTFPTMNCQSTKTLLYLRRSSCLEFLLRTSADISFHFQQFQVLVKDPCTYTHKWHTERIRDFLVIVGYKLTFYLFSYLLWCSRREFLYFRWSCL